MYNDLITQLNDGAAFPVQGVAVLRGGNVIILSEGGEHIPLNMGENICCYVRSNQAAKYDQIDRDCSQLYNVTEEMAMVFYQAEPKYSQESVIQYLRGRLAGISGVVIKDHLTDKEKILAEESLENTFYQYLKINFTYEYVTSIKPCSDLECLC